MNRLATVLTSVSLAATITLAAGRTDSALRTAINGPHQLTIDARGDLYVNEEYGKRVLRIGSSDHRVTVVAGNGKECCLKDDVPAQQSSVDHVYSLTLDSLNNLYIGGRNGRDGAFVRLVHGSTGKIVTLANGRWMNPAVGVEALNANLSDPKGIAVLPNSKALVSADEHYVIVSLERTTEPFAGEAEHKGFSGDGSDASKARFDAPGSLAVDGSGNVFVADYFNHRVRRIDAHTHIITSVAGNGSNVSSGDGGKATAAGVPYPIAIAVDPSGNLYVIENGQFKVRRVDAVTGMMSTVAGTGHQGFSGDGGLATKADMNPAGIAADSQGNLYIADPENNRIRRVDSSGVIRTIAGNGLPHRKPVIE